MCYVNVKKRLLKKFCKKSVNNLFYLKLFLTFVV